jgi:galactosamine-6-phosphate isomerase
MTTRPNDRVAAGPRFEAVTDYETLSRRAAELISDAVRCRPDLLLCAAAGSSPALAYGLLGQAARQDPALFGQVRVMQVDEWGGLAMADPATCETDLKTRLLAPLGITPDRYQGFRSDAGDPESECERVSQWLSRNGPIDLCVLGVGTNGHLAMNEPAEALRPGPHVACLSPSSLQHPMLAASKAVPAYGLTLGMGDLLQSRKILLLASGERKRPVLQRLREPSLNPQFPVSFLWLHPEVTVLCDGEAAP